MEIGVKQTKASQNSTSGNYAPYPCINNIIIIMNIIIIIFILYKRKEYWPLRNVVSNMYPAGILIIKHSPFELIDLNLYNKENKTWELGDMKFIF